LKKVSLFKGKTTKWKGFEVFVDIENIIVNESNEWFNPI
jgi:hypothetical protein